MKTEKIINFKDKNIFITGADGYIGSSLANYFFNNGSKLILTDKCKKPLKLKKLLNSKRVDYIQCDLKSKNSIKNLQTSILKKLSKLDVIIHNASYTGDSNLSGWSTDFKNQITDHWDNAFQITLKANFDLNKKFLDLLKKSKNPSIINISSVYGLIAPDWKIYSGTKINNPAGYSIAKSALIYMTKWMAKAFGPKIRVNCVSPGGLKRKQPQKFIKKYNEKVPLKRMASEEDVVNSVIFLASDMSVYVTGQNIVVDGGISL